MVRPVPFGGRGVALGVATIGLSLLCLSAAAGRQAQFGGADDWSLLGYEGNPSPVAVVAARPSPATRIEEQLSAVGTLVRTSYTDVGTVSSPGGQSSRGLRVMALEVSAGGGTPARGLALEVHGAAGRAVVYVDEGDIQRLSDACRELARPGQAGAFQASIAHVRLPGGLSLVNRDSGSGRVVIVSAQQVLDSGVLASAACPLDLNAFSQLAQHVDAARALQARQR